MPARLALNEDAKVTDRDQRRAETSEQVAKLIELGRDREAARLGASGDTPQEQPDDDPSRDGDTARSD